MSEITTSLLISLSATVLGAVTTAIIIYFVSKRLNLPQAVSREQREEMLKRQRELVEQIKGFEARHLLRGETESRIAKIIEEKKQKLVNLPSITFHYADKEAIRISYDDKFKEPTVASLVSEITGETTGEVKGSVPQIIESKIGGQDISKWISTIRLPETSINGMFLRYQREVITNGQATLGLEEVDIELSELKAFDDTIEKLAKRFGLELDGDTLEKQRDKLKAKAAERTLAKLEQATGAILIEGRFKIEDNGEFYKCIYLHPVSEYLPKETSPVTISISFPKGLLEPRFAGNYSQSIGRLIPLKVYGTVWEPIDRKTGIFELKLNPVAIYS